MMRCVIMGCGRPEFYRGLCEPHESQRLSEAEAQTDAANSARTEAADTRARTCSELRATGMRVRVIAEVTGIPERSVYRALARAKVLPSAS